MLLTRVLRPLALLTLATTLLAAPMPVAAADPPLGGPVTLPDGTVLPPLPPEHFVPSVQAEMLAEHGDVTGAVTDRGETSVRTLANAGSPMPAVEPRVAGETTFDGPGGPLPNGLRREVLGFLPYWKLDAATRAALRLDLVSTIAYFSIGVQSNGFLARGTDSSPTVGWSGWTSAAMTELMNGAHARGVRVVPTITLMAWDGDYSAMTTLLTNPANRARLVDDVANVISGRGADGVNVDFEPVPTSLRTEFTTFIRELKAGLVARGVPSYVSVDTMAGAASWATGYDVVGLTASGAADALMVMAYDFHWSGSSRAGGVAPIESDFIFAAGDALRAHLAQVPGNKLIWGVPYYGRAWNTTSDAQNATVRSPAQSVAFSYYWTDDGQPAGGRVLAERHGRRWDPTGQVPWFAFYDAGSDGWRQGYYDDGASLGIKYDMVLRNGLAGIGIWHLGMDTGATELWDLLADRFRRTQQRLAGSDRYATAAAVSAASFNPGVPVAYVATGGAFPDALAAGPAAVRGGGPVLLTASSFLPAATAGELARLRPSGIVVLGGTGAVSESVLEQLRPYATSGVVTRLAGSDRFGTAAAVSAAAFNPGVPVAYVAIGTDFPDALAGGVAAARYGGPILLVTGTGVPAATAAELARLRPSNIVLLGGAGVVSDGVLGALRQYATSGTVTRLAGANRFDTAVAISQASTPGTSSVVYVATGSTFADGLSGTPPAAMAGAPLLIMPSSTLTPTILAELRRLNPDKVVILGGTGAVSASIANQLAAAWD